VLWAPSERCSIMTLSVLSEGTPDCTGGDSISSAAAIGVVASELHLRLQEQLRFRPDAGLFERRNTVCPPAPAVPSGPRRACVVVLTVRSR
jgi:hypothetical protein